MASTSRLGQCNDARVMRTARGKINKELESGVSASGASRGLGEHTGDGESQLDNISRQIHRGFLYRIATLFRDTQSKRDKDMNTKTQLKTLKQS